MTVVAPCDASEMKRMMMSTLEWPHPMYIRLAKGGDQIVSKDENGFDLGKAILMRQPGEGLFITTGVMTQLALLACEELALGGVNCGILHMHTVKPLDNDALSKYIPLVESIITVEEHNLIGGLGSAILEFCSDEIPEQTSKIRRIGIPDHFAEQYGSQNSLLSHWGITTNSLVKSMINLLSK